MKRLVFLCIAALGSTSCVTMPPEAAKIMLHRQVSTQLDNCMKLGPVSAESGAWDLPEQAINNLRANAVKKYGDKVDSVALINVDSYLTKTVAHGLAFKCF
ncbi:MAG: hypothetical protein WD823_06085 [Sulfuricaulis sp.]|uniref:hypothetical protein n=1 Tax=Sulfuricaulis sp. TaxID=2003553 RepID=UPI0034A5AF19